MKNGIDYFPLEVQVDEKFELIEAEFGVTGFAIVVKLFQRIYASNGYYCEWNDDVALVFSKKTGVGVNVVSEILSASIKRGIFDKKLYERYHILTSRGIQKRYFEIVRRRKSLEIEKNYLLVSLADFSKNVDIFAKNVDISEENADIFKQSKVKESKVKKSKEEQSKESHPLPHEISEIQELYNNTCKSLPQSKTLTNTRIKAIRELLGHYSKNDIKACFEMAENSEFLKGAKGFTAGFDWLIDMDNFVKVWEGNYLICDTDIQKNLYTDNYDHEYLRMMTLKADSS